MAFSAKVVLDSISPAGKRLISVEFTQPRFVHSEFMTHRDRGRNAASSRAIPWERMKKMIIDDPVIPLRFGLESKGMQQGEDVLSPENEARAKQIILRMRDQCVNGAEELAALGLHKSICNRYTEPWMWITVLTTATEWSNLFRLRCHPMAEVHFQTAMLMVRQVIRVSRPRLLPVGAWHLPYLNADEYSQSLDCTVSDMEMWKKVSAGRCARLSYLTHDGRRDLHLDVKLAEKLIHPPLDPDEDIMHASPFEHLGECMKDGAHRSGPLIGWKQYRKEFANENVEGCDPWRYGITQ